MVREYFKSVSAHVVLYDKELVGRMFTTEQQDGKYITNMLVLSLYLCMQSVNWYKDGVRCVKPK